MSATPPVSAAPPMEQLERQLKWRVLPMVAFVGMLGVLLVLTVVALLTRPHHPAGLPDDADAQRAGRALAGRVVLPLDGLRARAALYEGEPAHGTPSAWMLSLGESARPALEGTMRRHPRDPRALAALGALDLLASRWLRAADHYREACELAPHYGEGRLGAGVALACAASQSSDAWAARGLRLQAIAQFAQVDSVDAEFPLALYDRALVLREVARPAEAAFYAQRYFARDDTSHWALALKR